MIDEQQGGNQLHSCALEHELEQRLGVHSGRQTTVKDIAKLAGVSTETVSRVVNGSGTVSRKTRTKVLTAISRVQYRPNAHAAELGRENGGIPRRRGIRQAALGEQESQAI